MTGVLAILAAGRPVDRTPAAVNWANISGTAPQVNADQAITGIDIAITLRLASSGVSGTAPSGSQPIYVGGSVVATHTVGGSATDFSVSPGQNVHFGADATGSSKTKLWTSTVTNQSDGGATLDTFTNSVTTTP